MDIKKEVTVTLNPKEIEQILVEFVEKKGIKVDTIHFNIGAHNDPADWRSEFPPTYKLDNIILKGTEK